MKSITTITDLLSNILEPKKTVFIGLGNVLKNDDGVGVYLIRKLIDMYGNELKNGVKLFDVGISLENYLTKILSLEPKTIIFFDAISPKQSFCKEIEILTKENLENYTFSTHNVSLSTIIEYLQFYTQKNVYETYVVGIKTYNTNFGETIDDKVKNTVEYIIAQIKDWVKE
jgi:hydrogenase 3 maturation protease